MKPKILIFIDWYLPAYKAGGPVKSVSNMVDALKMNFDFDIITSDRDFGDSVSFPNVKMNQWVDFSEGARVFYISEIPLYSLYKKIISENNYIYIYLNSLYSIKFSFVPLIVARFHQKKVILAPRGMLGKGAVDIKKLKKQFFICLFKFLLLDRYVKWQATSLEECKEIENVFDNKNISIAPNIPSVAAVTHHPKDKKIGGMKLCFISRISEKKNLLFALEKLNELDKILTEDKSIIFDIYGPLEDESYWVKCKDIIDSLQWKHTKISYAGVLKPDEIAPVLSKYHFLFLPTKNENFGHIIYESLYAGTPVIVSDQTPWRNLNEKNVGFDFDLNNDSKLLKMLHYYLEMNQEKFSEMELSVKKYILEIDLRKESIKQSLNLFS